VRDSALLFGGKDEEEYLNDLWEWSDSEKSWTRLQSVGDVPYTRNGHAMAFYNDGETKVALLFGGFYYNGSNHYLGELWQLKWQGKWGWEVITPSSEEKPEPRRGHRMVYDSEREKAIMFGGYDGSGSRSDVWEIYIDKNSGQWVWNEITPAECLIIDPDPQKCPAGRQGNSMVYDIKGERIVIYGGTYFDGGWQYPGDIWELLYDEGQAA